MDLVGLQPTNCFHIYISTTWFSRPFLQLVIGCNLCFRQAMTLMEYLIKTGSERVAQQCRENIYAVQTLKDFQFIDRDGKDQVEKKIHHVHKTT